MNRRGSAWRPGEVIQTLSRPPQRVWPQGAKHHGARLALLIVLALGVTFAFPAQKSRSFARFAPGEAAQEDVVAEIGFAVPKTPAELARDRAEAQDFVPPTFRHVPEAKDSMEARLARFFREVAEAAEAQGAPGVERILAREGVTALTGQGGPLLNPSTRDRLQRAALRVARELGPRLVDQADAAFIKQGRVILREESGEERSLPADSLLWGQTFWSRVLEILGPATPETQTLLRLILIRYFEPAYELDVLATERDREQARQAVPVVKGRVVPGQAIVRRGDVVGEVELERLAAYEAALREQGLLGDLGRDWIVLLGSFLLHALFLSVFGLLLFFFRKEVYGNYRYLLLLTALVGIYFLGSWLVARQKFPTELLPIPFVALPVAILWDGRMSLILVLVLGLMTSVLPPFQNFDILWVTCLGGAAGALSARAIRRRSQTWIFIALITMAYALAIASLGMLERSSPAAILGSILWAGLGATVSSILAMGFMPVFEWLTAITTDQTLLEWADPNRPLLKRLSLEAPGTYAHTIGVANLAEAAASAIGANSLLTRVGVYYHDVGKVLKPHFFVENQQGGPNPHEDLDPRTSAAIVREHVLEGERMAREMRVPDPVVRFIPEHHGTQLIGFFYEKARELEEDEPDPADFRYPGPKPRSRETAIAMLADSVESATRALREPTPERVRELVKTIVQGKIQDGQLDEAPLTLKELEAIQEAFVRLLEGMVHHRLEYPATRHITEATGPGASGAGPKPA